jgi:hypothetical protein
MPSSSSNFYSRVCRVLGALNRGALHKQAHVTVPASRAAWELGRALTAAGVLGGVAPVAPRRGRASADASPSTPASSSSTSSSFPAGATSLRYALRYDRGAPIYTPPGPAGHLSAPLSLGAPVLEGCSALSRPTGVRRATLERLRSLRRQLPPGILLLSTDAGSLLTDAEAEFLGVGGVVLGHVKVPLAQAVQARALLREKHEHEAAAAAAAAGGGGRRRSASPLGSRPPNRTPLSEWHSREHVARTVLPRLLGGGGGGPGEGGQQQGGPSAAEQALALLDAAEAREKRAAAAVAAARALAAQLATEEAALRGQVVGGGVDQKEEEKGEEREEGRRRRDGGGGGGRGGGGGGGGGNRRRR